MYESNQQNIYIIYIGRRCNLLRDRGVSFLGHWMFGKNRGNDTPGSWMMKPFTAVNYK